MRTDAFKAWLKANKKNVENAIACCRRVEAALGNLDLAFDADGLDSMIEHLSYTKADEHANKLPPDGISFKDGASIYDGMATLKSHVKTYRDFKRGQDGMAKHRTEKNFDPGLRDLFKRWIVSPEGGNHTKNVTNSYGTYVENSGILIPSLFDETVEGIDMGAVRRVATDISVRLQLVKGDIRSGLLALARFFKWICEHHWCRSYVELESYLPMATMPSGLRRRNMPTGNVRTVDVIDAYQEFFNYFRTRPLNLEAFYKFGIDKSIFADRIDADYAERQFEDLVTLLQTGVLAQNPVGGRNRTHLSIREYSRNKSPLFINLYTILFPDAEIRAEGNRSPKLNLRVATRCEMYSARYVGAETTTVLKNYVCSHVFDNRTQNPLLFEAVWNMAFTPKMIDPLTGNETAGRWPDEFQPIFRNAIRAKFLPCIRRFNAIAADVLPRVRPAALQVAQGRRLNEMETNRFVNDALNQWQVIGEEMEVVA